MTTISTTNLSTIKPLDMQKEAAEYIEADAQCWYMETESGEFPGETLHILKVEGNRFGLCVNGDTLWTDADDTTDAIERYETGTMRA